MVFIFTFALANAIIHMNIYKLTYFILFIGMSQASNGQTYYSAHSGDWNKPTTWTNSENGPGGLGVPEPGATVVIQSHHVINLPDKYTTGTMPEEIAVHPIQEKSHFIHNGKLTVNKGGTLQKTKGSAYVIFTGETNIKGTLDLSTRLYNLGDMIIFPEATANIEKEVVLAGKSATAIDIALKAKGNIFFIGTDAFLCGQGSILFEAPEIVKIQEFDNANADDQTCAGFVIDQNDSRGRVTIEFR